MLQSSRSWASFGLPSLSPTSGTFSVTPSAAPIGPSNRESTYGLLLGPLTLYTHQPPALQPATSTSHSVMLSLVPGLLFLQLDFLLAMPQSTNAGHLPGQVLTLLGQAHQELCPLHS
jgi:hypothetical protein